MSTKHWFNVDCIKNNITHDNRLLDKCGKTFMVTTKIGTKAVTMFAQVTRGVFKFICLDDGNRITDNSADIVSAVEYVREKPMKDRVGFVSNSSSASFVLQKDKMSQLQIWQVMDYEGTAKRLSVNMNDGWTVTEDSDLICGSTSMDNGDMSTLLKAMNLNYSAIVSWDGD